jgi:predicted permease
LARVQLPQYIYSPLYLIGGTMIPLALFMLGCHLAQIKIVSWKFPLIATCLRIGAGLGLGLLAVWLFRLEGVTAKVVILVSSLSSAITTVALAEEYDSSPELVSSTIALSTFVSMITIVLILNWFG